MPVSPFRPGFRLTLIVAALSLCGWPSCAWDAALMQAAAQKLGSPAVAALPSLQAMLSSLHGVPDTERLAIVNSYFNQRITFAEDIDVWGEVDRWASPLEALAKGRGDCEDYAIAKYASLLAAGVAPVRMRLVYVRVRLAGGTGVANVSTTGGEPGTAHMVLAYQATAADEPLILDNLRTSVMPASARPDLLPVFSFGTEGLWQGTSTASVGDPLARLSRWREVWTKVRLEGFL